eukprot:359639-Chlamydomonas_euryale.AAC.2
MPTSAWVLRGCGSAEAARQCGAAATHDRGVGSPPARAACTDVEGASASSGGPHAEGRKRTAAKLLAYCLLRLAEARPHRLATRAVLLARSAGTQCTCQPHPLHPPFPRIESNSARYPFCYAPTKLFPSLMVFCDLRPEWTPVIYAPAVCARPCPGQQTLSSA